MRKPKPPIRPPKPKPPPLAAAVFGAPKRSSNASPASNPSLPASPAAPCANPSYEQVCTGTTGHAEVIQLNFDPAVLSYDKVLEIFWEAHDPTTLNRQGADIGTQYRSIILYSDEAQKMAAEASKAKAAKHFKDPIVTEIVPLKAFYPAEDYHQNYYNLNKNQSYCQFVITPKLKKLIEEGVIPQTAQ